MDASVNDAAVAPTDGSSASSDAGGETLDAAPPPEKDAAPPARPDASADSAILDSATLDSATLDSAALDSAMLDSATTDAAAPDGGSALDARATGDAGRDASEPGDASAQDAAQNVRERSGEVRWNVRAGRGSDLCPHQWIALWKDETVTRYDPSSPGFECYLSCDVPADLDTGEATFLMVTAEMDMFLIFRARVMLGYSTESFRANLLRAQVHWKSPSKTSIGSGIVEFSSIEPAVEIVSYQAPLLHVRVQARSVWATNTFNEPSTVPYPCVVATPIGTIPTVCTTSECGYATEDATNGVSLSLDLTLPIEPPTP